MRDMTQDDLNAAARGLRMATMPVHELDALIAEFTAKDTFAARVIAAAARQIRGVRARNFANG